MTLPELVGRHGLDKNKKESSEARSFVMAVDDDPTVLRIIETFLGQHNYFVKTALSGEEALSVLMEEIPAVLILDVIMPGTSGYDICRLVKRDIRLKEVPVIFLTSKSAPKDFKIGHDLGAVIYMTKPFKPQKLLHVVQMLCPGLQEL